MKITFEFSGGGYVALGSAEPLVYVADTDELTADERTDLEEAVRASGLLGFEQDASRPAHRGLDTYRLNIQDSGQVKSFQFAGIMDAPQSARPLLGLLEKRARQTRMG